MIGKSHQLIEILLAEDSPTQAAQLQHILEQHDFHVTVARSGNEALRTMLDHVPTLIISDVTMPGMDGFELCRRIRNDERTRLVPVILLTSLSDPEDVFRGLECGADNFITKPYEVESLVARIHYLLGNIHLRDRERMQMSMDIVLAGQKHTITSDRAQILNLLLSTYEAAVQKNRELSKARDELTRLNGQLEEKVQERTALLAAEVEERRRAEEEVRKLNDDLEVRVRERTAELEAFSYSVSHDLRAPLRAVDGYSKLLMDRYMAELPAEAQRLLSNVRRSAGHMGELIDALLRFSRLSLQPLAMRSLKTDTLVRQVVDEVIRPTTDRHVDIRVGNLPDCIGDFPLIRQVFVNLLANAIKFTRHKEPCAVEVDCQRQNGENVFFVRDNGVGFDMQYAGRLFGIFQRLHSASEFEGTGVGLSIVQRILHRHGGRIWAEAEPGRGATFYFTLPG